MKTVLVTGSAGFIGGHLVTRLQKEGCYVIGADIQKEKYSHADKFYNVDLTSISEVIKIFDKKRPIYGVYNLAAQMGGMGYLHGDKHAYDIMIGSTQIILNIIHCSRYYGVLKHFYSSSACVFNMHKQETTENISLKESDAYPAMPDLVYGWQKLFGEQLYQATIPEGFDIRIARFHNIFGTNGTWDGGKEKAPAALCRKISLAKDGDEIEVWGDGNQVRSFLYIDECLDGVMRLMDSNINYPINIGSDESISINDLAKMIIEISGKNITIKNDLTKPQGVRGRNSDNTLIKKVLGWSPTKPLREGIEKLYAWVNSEVNK